MLTNLRVIYYFISYFSVALVLSLIFVPLMRSLSFKAGAVDRGEGRRIHKGIIPRLGGVGIYIAFTLPMIFYLTRSLNEEFNNSMFGILIASTIVFLIGVYDDLRSMRIREKLLCEIIAAGIVYAWGVRITIISNPFGDALFLGWISLPVTILWIIIITNAFNLIDGIDGLAAGTGILISATLFFLLEGSDIQLRLTFAVLAGSLAGFLVYNFPPASIFMGDSGSLFAGFLLASVSIISFHKATAMTTIMIPILAFSLPVIDMLYAVLRRYYRGIPLGEADKEHIHHKLLDKGFSKKKVLLLLYSVNISIMVCILLIVRRQLNIDILGLLLFVIAAAIGLRVFGYIEFIPAIRQTLKNHDNRRKSKFFTYLINKFEKKALKADSSDELRAHLKDLVIEYGFSSAEIQLQLPGFDDPFFYFKNNDTPRNPLTLNFPILFEGNGLGTVSIVTEMEKGSLVCASELINVISEQISRYAERRSRI